jgi:hypothetical protein
MPAYGACSYLLLQQRMAMPRRPDRLSSRRKDMILARLRNLRAALCVVCFMLIGNAGAKVRQSYAALLDIAGKRSEISLGLGGRLLPAAK